MLHSRNVTLLFVFMALAGAALLWWNLTDDSGSTTPSTGARTVDEGNAAGPAEGRAEPHEAPTRIEAEIDRVEAVASPSKLEDATELRVLATWPDQTPAAEVMVALRRSVSGLPYAAVARKLTNADGLVVFEDVPRGPSTLVSDREDRKKITVEGGRQEVSFELKGGIAVRGAVKSPSGAPVPNASIWLQTRNTTWAGGRVVGFANAMGEFELEQILPKMSLAAIAAGFAPSKLLDLDIVDTSNPPAIVILTVRPDGGRLEGTVTDANREPVAQALVAVGSVPAHLTFDGNRCIEQWTPRTASTNEDGFFAIDGLVVGETSIAIRTSGYGIWRGVAAIDANTVAVVSPQLQRSATLTGTVTDREAAPLPEVAVRVYDKEPGTDFVAGGQIDYAETFSYRGAITGPDGSYRIEGVTPGTLHAFAQRNLKRGDRDGVSVAYTQVQLQVEPGTEATWSPVIDNGPTIEGVVLFANGDPIPNLFVTLKDETAGGKEHTIVSNGEGVFRFLCLEDYSYEIQVQAHHTAPSDAEPIQADGVYPNGGRVILRAAYDKPEKKATGHVNGRIDDAAGRIRNPNAATITMTSEARWFRSGIKIEHGAFFVKNVTPGRIRLTLKEHETVLAVSDWFDLEPGATLDTGVLTTGPGGSVQFVITRTEGAEQLEPKLDLHREPREPQTTIEVGRRTEFVADNLSPGEYDIRGYGKGMIGLLGEVEVIAGETTTARLTLRAGVRFRCDVWWPEETVRSVSRSYRIVNTDDGSVHRQNEGRLLESPTKPLQIHATIPPGNWKIEVSTDDGLSGEAVFVVQDTTKDVTPRIELK